MGPLELVAKEKNEHERALEKSVEMYENGVIDKETHETHKRNLTKIIAEYTVALNKLLE